MIPRISKIKLTQWEYWPSYMFYFPLIPYYIYKAIRAKNLVFYLATNPAIKYSGNGTESKYKTLQLIPEKYRPKSVLVDINSNFNQIKKALIDSKIDFPIIAKPDIGFRGFLVKKIDNSEQLKNYLKKVDIPIIIQEFITLKNECGVFYSRIPDTEKGNISSLTLKKFLTATGDGASTLSQLILNDDRAKHYYQLLQNIHKEKMNEIPDKGNEILLSVIGNHAKGTQFINGNHLIDLELHNTFDLLNKQIDGWYYGRLDIKYDTFEKLKKGEDYKILEINGIIAEPTHMYDAQGATYFDAIKSIKNHWRIINKIALTNHKKFNVAYPEIVPYLKDMLWLRKYAKKIVRLTKEA